MEEKGERVSPLESVASHVVLVLATCFALYPVLWVVSMAFSAHRPVVPELVPVPHEPTLAARAGGHVHLARAAGRGSSLALRAAGRELASSSRSPPPRWASPSPSPRRTRSRASASSARSASVSALLATQMFPTVASLIPLYILLHELHLLDSRTGLVLCYASTSVPFAIFQLRAAFEAIPADLEEAAMVDGATRFGAFLRVVLPAARPAIAVTAALRVHERLQRVHPGRDAARVARRCSPSPWCSSATSASTTSAGTSSPPGPSWCRCP